MLRTGLFIGGVLTALCASEAGALGTGPTPQPEVTKPALCASYTDPAFGSTVTRMTDRVLMGFSGVVNEYSKAQPWNADNSLFIARSTNGHYFLINEDCTELGELPFGGGSEPRWSPSDPNVLRYFSGNEIREYRVDSGASTTLHTFSEYESVGTRGEGNWSADFSTIALFGFQGGEIEDAFAYRATDDKVFPRLSLVGQMPVGIDWISISPSGQKVLIMFGDNDRWQAEGSAGRALGRGLDVFELDMTNRRRVQDHVHHGDVCLTEQGEDAFIGSAANAPGADLHRIRLTKLADALPLSGSNTQAGAFTSTSLLVLDWFLGVHVSCRNTAQPGWAYVSTFSDPAESAPPEAVAFSGEVFAVRTDGSGEVRRLAHLHAARVSYFEEPHAVVSRDGRSVLFTSNWGESPGADQVDVYRVTVAGGGGAAGAADDAGGAGGVQGKPDIDAVYAAGCSVSAGGADARALAPLIGLGLALWWQRRRARRRQGGA